MSEAFESIKAGLDEAIAHSKGERNKVVLHPVTPMDVKAVRSQVGMSQHEFAASFGISLGTLRHWERGDRQPHGPARVLLSVLAKKPEAVLSVLSDQT